MKNHLQKRNVQVRSDFFSTYLARYVAKLKIVAGIVFFEEALARIDDQYKTTIHTISIERHKQQANHNQILRINHNRLKKSSFPKVERFQNHFRCVERFRRKFIRSQKNVGKSNHDYFAE